MCFFFSCESFAMRFFFIENSNKQNISRENWNLKFYVSNIASSECSDERLKAYNGTCYLFVSYPEVDWQTAQSVCRGIGAQLASVSTADEQR